MLVTKLIAVLKARCGEPREALRIERQQVLETAGSGRATTKLAACEGQERARVADQL